MATRQDVDWQANCLLPECNKYMLDNAIASDLHFKTKNDESGTTVLDAHKYVLASRSSVFFAMFYGPMAETTDTVSLPDIPTKTFKLFLEYLYTDKITLTGDNVCGILYTARKYCVSTLVTKCEAFLKTNMTSDNVCTIMNAANTLGLAELVQSSCYFILKNKHVFDIKEMNQLSHDCFKLIIASDNLAFSETDIFKVVLSWAENQCQGQNLALTSSNKRRVLGDILFLVRFPLVDTKVIADTADTGLLTPEEQLEIFKSAARGESALGGKFSSQQRRPLLSLCLVPRKFYENYDSPARILCLMSKSVKIKGILCKFSDFVQTVQYRSTFVVYPRFRMFNQYLRIDNTYRNEVRTQKEFSVSAGNTEHKIMLPHVVTLNQDEHHLLCFTMEDLKLGRPDGFTFNSAFGNPYINVSEIPTPKNCTGTESVVCNDIEFTFLTTIPIMSLSTQKKHEQYTIYLIIE